MKLPFKIFAIVIFISASLFGYAQTSDAKKTDDKYTIISEKINNKSFVFEATSITPINGPVRILTSPYDVKVYADSVVSFLPYFGNAQQAPVNTADAGIIFTSTGFEYLPEKGKKNTWNLVIKFKDQRSASTFTFIVYDNGDASLNVTSMYRSPVTFRGTIKL